MLFLYSISISLYFCLYIQKWLLDEILLYDFDFFIIMFKAHRHARQHLLFKIPSPGNHQHASSCCCLIPCVCPFTLAYNVRNCCLMKSSYIMLTSLLLCPFLNTSTRTSKSPFQNPVSWESSTCIIVCF